ncbi:MAG: BLUF domain-containing protein [Kiloniellaceae bacterium]
MTEPTSPSDMPPVHRLMYTSTSREFMSDEDLAKLLERARCWNEANGITGMLIYVDGHFLQIVEGAEQDIAAVSQRIFADSQHFAIIRLMEGTTPRRVFSDWSMGLRRLGKRDGAEILGAVNLARQSVIDSLPCDTPQELVVFMESFYRSSVGLHGHEDVTTT